MKHKLKEWTKRYLPAEIAGTTTAMMGGGVAYSLTQSVVVSSVAAAWSENIGCYGTILLRDIYQSHTHHKHLQKRYTVRSFLKTIRNIIIEFGPAEIFDSAFIRPFMMFLFTSLFHSVYSGTLTGKIVADVIFYIPTIMSYEMRKKYLS